MVIPHDAQGRTYSLRVPHFVIRGAIFLAVFALLFVASSFVFTSHLVQRQVFLYKTRTKNLEQQAMINDFSRETKKVHLAISELVRRDNELRRLLGLKSWKSQIKLSNKFEEKADKVSQDLKVADLKLAEKTERLIELKDWVSKVRQRYAFTPSRWPIYGRIVSRYGYRVYPWRGLHTGLDISGSYGSPIRATADGVVSYVGWRQGYGKTVMISHSYDTSTLYGHCSRYAVKSGQKVSKGQVICYVGNTGYSTGPHLHYEVRKAGKPVNPVSYLDLNILTASKIWRQ